MINLLQNAGDKILRFVINLSQNAGDKILRFVINLSQNAGDKILRYDALIKKIAFVIKVQVDSYLIQPEFIS